MNVYLIRHAHAGDRGSGAGDLYRPLSAEGRQRAEELATMLADRPITRVLSSPATRCTQTVEPLARGLGLEVEEAAALAEGSSWDEVVELLARDQDGEVVACSHGDVIPELIDGLAAQGVAVSGRGCEKGSIWVLEGDGRQWLRARYVSKKAVGL